MFRIMRWLGVLFVVLAVGIQLVPYGRDHTNPPVVREPPWDSPQTRALVVRACFDCHSNETEWRWYSHVAPVSWLIQRDVEEGRRALNYSEWHVKQREAHESAKTVKSGEMPPWFYAWRAPMSAQERAQLIAGLGATFGTERSRDRRTGARHEVDKED